MGELAALFTSLSWSVTSIQFTLAGRRVGSPIVNRVRLLLALFYLSTAQLVLTGALWPSGATRDRWLWLGLSGIIGLVLGDACLFQAYVLIGPRRGQLLMTSVPIMSTLMAWFWLGEALTGIELVAMALAVGGIGWVVSERARQDSSAAVFPGDTDHRARTMGILLGLGGALGQAVGLLLSKKGMEGGFSPLSATIMRILVAAVVIWLVTALQGRVRSTWQALEDRTALRFIAGGAFTGPFLGVWASMIAVQNAPIGVASTLMALPPILLIPLTHWVFHERVTPRAVAGTLVALSGAALLFLT